MKIELAEVARSWSENGLSFEEGQILMGEYQGQGLREPIFIFPVTISEEEKNGKYRSKAVQVITHLSDKRVIPVLEGLILR